MKMKNKSYVCIIIFALIIILKFISAYDMTLYLSEYPYTEVNKTQFVNVVTRHNNTITNNTNISINLNGTIYSLNYSGVNQNYFISFSFLNVGNYPFTIFSNLSNYTNISGTFKVYIPFNVTFCGFKDAISTIYKNEFAYVTAEYSDGYTYNSDMETFISRIRILRKPVFYASYINGCAVLKLYDKTNYAIRLIDGVIIFPQKYSIPNITKSYGTDSFIGVYRLNETTSYNVIFTNKDLNPYFWVFNWSAMLLIIFCVGLSVTLFFMLPDYPVTSLGFFIISTLGIIIIRVVVWFYLG